MWLKLTKNLVNEQCTTYHRLWFIKEIHYGSFVFFN